MTAQILHSAPPRLAVPRSGSGCKEYGSSRGRLVSPATGYNAGSKRTPTVRAGAHQFLHVFQRSATYTRVRYSSSHASSAQPARKGCISNNALAMSRV